MNTNRFEPTGSHLIAGLDVTVEQYLDPASGARHLHLNSTDTNNAFMVAFPTLPEDSTGVAHILEHTTLCGSRRFPVRDPFFMMLRRSLNTYMNAFTSGDCTAYPFATQNRKDFDNLLGVYLDAVFFPRLHPLDFAQEGWRLEAQPDQTNPELSFHGVVYNEMKGAMSSPLAQLWQHLHSSLFPDTIYAHNSGGDPLAIPDLTHEDLLAFHRRHYQPANAVFMTYGNFPASEHQQKISELALDALDEAGAAQLAPLQAAFSAPREIEVSYHVDDMSERCTHIVWAWVCGATDDPDAMMEAHFLSSVLLEHGASALRHYLETSELANAPSELCGVDDSARQLIFMCGVEGSDRQHAESLEQGIAATLERLVNAPPDAATLEAAMDRLELAQRDIGGGSYPFGLQLMGRALPAAMYRGDVAALLDLAPAIERLRNKLNNGYFTELLRSKILNNPHRARVVMSPDTERAARDAHTEAERLKRIGTSLSADDLTTLTRNAEALRERQAHEDDPDVLPRVTLADVPAATPLMVPSHSTPEPLAIHEYECGSNGIFRTRLAYELPQLNAEQMRCLPLFCDYLSELGAAGEDYLKVQEQRARIGSFAAQAIVRPTLADKPDWHAWLTLSGKGLERKRNDIMQTVFSLLTQVRFDEYQRLQDLLMQSRAEAEQEISDRGHQLAMLAAARGLSPSAALDELWDGPSSILYLKELTQQPENAARLGKVFESIRDKLLASSCQLALIGDTSALQGARELVPAELFAAKPDPATRFAIELPQLSLPPAWRISAQVNYCAKAYPVAGEAHRDAPLLAVVGKYLVDGFLHREIREQGGAYGSGAAYDADGFSFRFFSYRDPRALATLNDFDAALNWFAEDTDEDRLEQAILGTVRSLDQPHTPAGEAERAFAAHLCGRNDASRQRFREGVLGATHDKLRDVAARWLKPERGAAGALLSADGEAELNAAGFATERLQ